MSNLQANWNYPTDVRTGAGRISELGELCKDLGMKAPLLVTDPGLAKLPIVATAVKSCTDVGLHCKVFSDIQGNPNGEHVDAGVAAFREGQHDGVIAFGGGSGIDAAKAVALVANQSCSLWDLEDIGDNWTRADPALIAPVIAVPTTAGTGSEVGRASVITDNTQHIKKIIFHPDMLPKIVILDPELTVGLPASITATTGMDALSHNLEALCSPFYHPMAEGIAIEGIRLVKQYLPRAYKDGSDIEARTQMLVASSMGATAFQKGLGGMHAIAHSLGALYGTHHGLLNAILMPYVLVANKGVIEERMIRLARYLDLDNPSFESTLQWVLNIRAQLSIPHTLGEIGIDEQQAEKVATMATADAAAGGNPIAFTVDEYRNIFKNALIGHIEPH